MEAQSTDSSDIVFRLLGWLHANRKAVTAGVLVVAVVGIATGLYSWKQGQNDIDADTKLLSLPVGNDLRVHAPGDKLQELASEYPSTPAGEYAALLAGENLFVSGNFIEAERSFTKFLNDYPASALAAEAGLGVAASLEAQNKLPEATQQYQKVIQANPTEAAVVEPAKLTLGRIAEEQNHFDQAFTQYRELAQSPNPNDLWAGEAKERLQLLVASHPELLKQFMAQNASPVSAVPRIPILSAGPATTLSTAPAGSNPAPRTLPPPMTAPNAPAPGAH